MTDERVTPSSFKPVAAVPCDRLDAIDWLRGLVMAIMALDHLRNALYFQIDPTNLDKTNVGLFLTRWITHFCAPTFMFLAGTGAFLAGARKTKPQLAWFLFSRGLWLVLLELTIIRFGYSFDLEYRGVGLIVIWAIGWSMVMLAGLVFLPAWLVGLLGVAIMLGHNGLDGVKAEAFGPLGWLWAIFHSGEAVGIFSDGTVRVLLPTDDHDALALRTTLYPAYALLPWLGVMAAGYGFGLIMRLERSARRHWCIGLGLAATLAFLNLRAINGYGDPKHWTLQRDELFTLFSFLNCHKYPPSASFLLMTLGPALLALAWFDRPPGPLGRCLIVYGRVPLFYYVIHWYVIALAFLLVNAIRYGPEVWKLLTHRPPDYGFPLVILYVVWLDVLIFLYPLCRWYANLKRRSQAWWLSYL